MLTAENITDEQIRELRWVDPSARHKTHANMYAAALGNLVGATPERIAKARAKCAELANDLTNRFCGRLGCPGGSLHAHDIDDNAFLKVAP